MDSDVLEDWCLIWYLRQEFPKMINTFNGRVFCNENSQLQFSFFLLFGFICLDNKICKRNHQPFCFCSFYVTRALGMSAYYTVMCFQSKIAKSAKSLAGIWWHTLKPAFEFHFPSWSIFLWVNFSWRCFGFRITDFIQGFIQRHFWRCGFRARLAMTWTWARTWDWSRVFSFSFSPGTLWSSIARSCKR